MNHPAHIGLVKRLLAQVEGAPAAGVRVGEIPSSHYASPARFEEERAAVFGRVPVLVAHESELAEAGSCVAVEVAGVSLLVVRGDDGSLKAFRNACRHRSTRLVAEDVPCKKKAFVCPYHGWTYDLGGRLIHVPHKESFRGHDASRTQLVDAYVASEQGFVWASLAPFEAGQHLEPIRGELESFGSPEWMVYRQSTREVRGNWKLIVDAFLDGYHIRHLHRDSVYRFFVDALYEAEPAGDHIRAATARRTLLEARPASLESVDLRQLVTPSYLLYPNTIVVMHPDYASFLTATPLSADRSRFTHRMLIPKASRSDALDPHWAKSFTLIDEGVFSKEDLTVVEAMQRGIESGANETLLFGELEHAVLWFHDSLERTLAAARSDRS